MLKGDCQFRACLFEDDANFDRLQVMGILEVRAPKERAVLNVNKELTNSDDSNSPSIFMLQPWVIFKKEARFSQIHVKGEANFGSAKFEGWADFYNAKIEGPAFFRIDRSKNQKKGFDNKIFIENPVRFHRGVRFRFAYFGDELNFHGADFSVREFRSPKSGNPADDPWNKDKAKKTLTEDRRVDKAVIDFTYVHCTRVVFFCDPDQPKNGKKCTFSSIYKDFNDIPQLENLLDFEGACFNQSVYFSANFPTSGPVSRPYNVVSFRDCRIDGELSFYGISPEKTPETETALTKYLRLTGCAYKRIEADSVAISERIKILEQPSTDKSTQIYDRRSWTQLESSLRAEGLVQEADEVYVQRRESRHKSLKNGLLKKMDRIFGWLTSYGTNNRKMVEISFVTIFGGAVLFGFWGNFRQDIDDKKIHGLQLPTI